jgi:uncharacterized Tic20 family protein
MLRPAFRRGKSFVLEQRAVFRFACSRLVDAPPLPSAATAQVREERTWAMVAHLSAFAGHFFPFAHIVAPLVVWLSKRETSAFVDDQGKEAVNAQISVTLYALIGIPLVVFIVGAPLLGFALLTHLVVILPALPFCLGAIVLLAMGFIYIANFALVIVAAIAANEGRAYRYPFIVRLVK